MFKKFTKEEMIGGAITTGALALGGFILTKVFKSDGGSDCVLQEEMEETEVQLLEDDDVEEIEEQ